MGVNRVILLGNVGGDPQIRYADGKPIAEFSLATSEPPTGTLPERVEWHRIVMMGRNAELAEKYVRKGTKLYLEGKLRTRFWEDRNTIKRNVTEVYVDTFEIIGRG